MQVYKTFLKIFKKQLGSCSIYLVIFLGLIVGFSKLGGRNTDKYETYSCSIAVFDRDNSEASRKLTEYLTSIHELVSIEDDLDTMQKYLYFQKIDYILYIEDGYESTGELTNIKRPGSNTGMYVDGQISSYESSVSALLLAGYNIDEAYDITLRALSDEGLVQLRGNYAGEKPEYYYFFLYLAYVIIMMMFQGLCAVLVAFNKPSVSDRINISSFSVRKRNWQLIAGITTVGLGTWFIFVILAFIMYGGELLRSSTLYLVLNSLVYSIMVIGMVSIAGNFMLKSEGISMVSNIIGLGFSFLGGVFVPMSIFGEGLKRVSMVIPTYWYVMANDNIMAGENIENVLPYICVEFLFCIAFISASMLISKRKRLARVE